MNINFLDLINIIIAGFSLFLAYKTIILNRPKIHVKTLRAKSKDENINFDRHFKLKIINYGNKPAFNLKILSINDTCFSGILKINDEKNELENFQQYIEIAEKIKEFEKSNKSISLDFLNNSNKVKINNLFSKEIDFILCNSFEILDLGTINIFSNYNLKEGKHILNVEYRDIRNLDPIFKGIISILGWTFFIFFSFFGYFSFLHLIFIFLINIFQIDIDIQDNKYTKKFKEKIIININQKCDFFEETNPITAKSSRNLFNEKIYETWENNLTKSEFKIFKKYRLKYGDDIYKYIELYKNIEEEIPKQNGLKLKIHNLIEIFCNEGILDKSIIKELNIINIIKNGQFG
jgi:hypothetical protein